MIPVAHDMLGRAEQKERILSLLKAKERLLSITGLGGIGKTTLALAVAHEWVQSSLGPVWFCSLSHVKLSKEIPLVLAQTLHLRNGEAQLVERLVLEYFIQNPGVLIFDNFEHLISATSFLTLLLESCPELQILVTSRETLRLREEYCVEVPPLTPAHSVLLFQKQAMRINPQFQISPENTSIVTEICCRLDGIPLAIELAASRLLLFSLEELLEGLQNRLQILSGGRRDMPERQQTLRSTLAWSYDLLSEQERLLFRLLSVFIDGATTQAVEFMYEALGLSYPLDSLAELMHKHLLCRTQENGKSRLVMLETIHEYAFELLEQGDQEERERLRDTHAHYFLSVLTAPEESQTAWLSRLDLELGNIQSAVVWLFTRVADEHQQQHTITLVHMVYALARYWEMRGRNQEAFGNIMRMLALSEQSDLVFDPEILAEGYTLASKFALVLGNLKEAFVLAQDASRLLQQHQSPSLAARAFLQMGMVEAQRHQFIIAEKYLSQGIDLFRSITPAPPTREQEELGQSLFVLADTLADRGEEYERPLRLLTESLHIFQKSGNLAMAGRARHHLSVLFYYHNRLDDAIALGEQCLSEVTNLGYPMPQAYLSTWLAAFLLPKNETTKAETLISQSLTLFEQLHNKHGISWSLIIKADLFVRVGSLTLAQREYTTALEIARSIADIFLICRALEGLAEIVPLGDAIRLIAEATAIRAAYSMKIQPVFLPQQERLMKRLHAAYSNIEMCSEWMEGQQQARTFFPRATPEGEEGNVKGLPLTAREKEILALIAQGDQNKEIAVKLQISSRTVNAHVQSIYTKLRVNTRTAATRIYLLEQVI